MIAVISVCSSDLDAQENLKYYFHDRLSDEIYTTFRELFSKVNIDSLCEVLPKINEYNWEIAKFVEDINAKYGIALKYTQLEISEIKHWAETFEVVVNTCSQPGQQQPQVPQITAAVPSPQAPSPSLREQQEINRLTYMEEQWSAEEAHRLNEGAAYYNTLGRSRSTCHCSTPSLSPVPLDYGQLRHYDSQGHNRYNNYNRRSKHYKRPEADHGRYSQALPNKNNDSATVVINVLESFSAKQALAQYTLNAIQEFNGSDRESTLSWLDQG